LAISDFTEALQLNDSLAKAYYNRGYAHSEQGNFGIALKDFEKANALEYPGEPLFWFRWGETLLKIGMNFEDAIKKLSNAIAHDINFTGAYASRGYAYLQLDKKHYREARNDLDRALKGLTDKDKDGSLLIEVHNNWGRLEARENNYPVAIHHYQEALKIDENYYLARYHLAKAYKDNNQFELALTEFKSVEQIAPANSTEAEQARKWIACLEANHKTVVIDEESI
jgi:tetratricopeptide (TPR) repeat protein